MNYTKEQLLRLRLEKLLTLKARYDLKTFLLLKWQRYKQAPSNDNWHISYLCKVLESTLPFAPAKQIPQIPNTRLMINMPPSYGKTEIIARTFIAWALGCDRKRKFFYISYSDELCKKISNEVRDLLKSDFWASIFGTSPKFLQDNANEFVLKEGGGLFATTLKSALTGFHAHQILIDDPIKVIDMNSRAERNRVNQNFKETVLSRLQDNFSNITILMQRLGYEDLCGFLLDEKNFNQEVITQWQIIKLQAINKEKETYKIGDFAYIREANEALFPQRHTIADLEHLKLAMGEDEFSTQYLQEPQVSEAGFFESVYFKTIPSYEQEEQNEYIFVDNATSLQSSADNRALVLIGVEYHNQSIRYVVKDCLFGIWSEEETLKNLLDLMSANKKAKVFIEFKSMSPHFRAKISPVLAPVKNAMARYNFKSPLALARSIFISSKEKSSFCLMSVISILTFLTFIGFICVS
ncbi:hypothetical protein ACRE1U_04645 [Helicobacter himalayensis]|uniref:hypothetical protein n=1 Tax=Helicobacter himalayensis TaxID=1591088 RepID=UPI003D6F6EB2